MKLEVQEDSNGEIILEFPDELMDAVGWKAGDVINWEQQCNGDWVITKSEKLIPEDNDNEY